MRVLHVVLGLDIGGLEAFVLDLSRAYSANVTSIIVCLRGHNQVMAEGVEHVKIVYLDGPDKFSLALVNRLAKLIRSESIEIVHTHNAGPHLYGALAGRICGKPVIHTKHGRGDPENRRKVSLSRMATMLTDRVIAVSYNAELVCSEIESVPSAKVKTILNGTDATAFKPQTSSGALRRTLAIPIETPIIGIVARLSNVKNHSLLLRSVRELIERGRKAALVVIGDGPLDRELKAEANMLDLNAVVHFLGPRTDVTELYPQLDVVVLTSRSEGISLTLLEAMSCERPVIATRVGGNPEVVIDGVTGILVEQDVNAIASAFESLLFREDSDKKREDMGKHGRERVLSTFSMDATAQAYLEEYTQLLSLKRK